MMERSYSSTEKIYELFRSLKYLTDKVLDPTYKRKIEEFEFAKEEKEKIKDIYTALIMTANSRYFSLK